MDDPKLEKLTEFLSIKSKQKATTKEILSRLGLWGSKEEFKEWRRPHVQSGVLVLGRGRGGTVSLGVQGSLAGGTKSTEFAGLSPKAKRILELIPQEGSIGNTRLRARLGMSVEEYMTSRKDLLTAGLIEKGKGRGGSVSRTSKGLGAFVPLSKKTLVAKESDLYAPLKDGYAEKVLPEGADFHYSRITAFLAGKEKTGMWSRPDVTYIQVTDYPNLPTPIVEVTSFEVKPHDAVSLAGVYEAAAHSRWAHNCYLVVEAVSKEEAVKDDVTNECERLGVGLLTMFKEPEGYQFAEKLEPKTQDPNPELLDDFLDKVFSDSETKKKEFRKWIRK